MLTLHIENASGDNKVPDDAEIHRWASAAVGKSLKEAEISVRLVSSAESAQLNGQYRGKPQPTNVLSFPVALPADIPGALLGDLAICVPVVACEAREQQKQLEAHWAHMVIHGCLHLLGYDHVEPAQAEQMEALEASLLQKLGFPDPYQTDFFHTTGQQQ